VKTKQQSPLSGYRKLSDEELVYRYVHRREQAAVFRLYDKYGHLVYAVCRRYFIDPAAAGAAVRHIFLRVPEELRQEHAAGLKRWLLALTERHCRSVLNAAFAGTAAAEANDITTAEDGGHSCLGRRQLAEYAAGTMPVEECHAVDMHIGGCALCREAVTGLRRQPDMAAAELARLDAGFLREHFAGITPQVHLNAIALSRPTPPPVPGQRRRRRHPYQHVPLTALLLALGVLLYREWRPVQEQQALPQHDHQRAAIIATARCYIYAGDRQPAAALSPEAAPEK